MDSFEGYLKRSKVTPNKVGLLIDMFTETHTNAPQSDFIRINGRMAGIYKQAKGNTDVIIRAIWCSCAKDTFGSHLDYIQKAVQGYMKSQPSKAILKGHAGMETD
jgi:hypothetical protein